ncbi:MAG: PilZ domain-containing protein [Planctomycetota bacterium]|nr:PilZ domain-containing protein [Planctomycetota bacterium]MCZ6817464.1 PilZ domain-containing protein [Planctomycetota bacterium]
MLGGRSLGGAVSDPESIPLCDQPSSSRVILPETPRLGGVRGHRFARRSECVNVSVCFAPRFLSGRADLAECPASNISESGMAIEYDAALNKGLEGTVTYRTLDHSVVRIRCRVRICKSVGDGRFLVGLEFARRLRRNELSPARRRPGRDIAPGLRPRKLRPSPQVSAEA